MGQLDGAQWDVDIFQFNGVTPPAVPTWVNVGTLGTSEQPPFAIATPEQLHPEYGPFVRLAARLSSETGPKKCTRFIK